MVQLRQLSWRAAIAFLKLSPYDPSSLVQLNRRLSSPNPLLGASLTTLGVNTTAVHPQIEVMKFANEDKFADEIHHELSNTKYACSVLEPLSSGSSNFMFKGTLAHPLEDGTTEVAVKHTEGFVAASPELFMETSRCRVEKKILETLSMVPPTLGSCIVRTPKLLYFNSGSNTQVLEYLAASVDLKTYVLKHLSGTRDPSRKTPCVNLGASIGAWLKSFHHWTSLGEQSAMHEIAQSNEPMQRKKHELYYERLVDTIDDYPSILGGARGAFEDIRNDRAAKLKDPQHLQIIHGDLWTGNAILPDAPLKRGVPVFIIDWEFCQLGLRSVDLGQMMSELYQLYQYKNIEDAKWLYEGLVMGYGYLDDRFAFETAIHIGAHLISFGSRMKEWGTETQIQQSVRIGMEMIVHAWHEDRGWFEAGDLACLFAGRDRHPFAVG